MTAPIAAIRGARNGIAKARARYASKEPASAATGSVKKHRKGARSLANSRSGTPAVCAMANVATAATNTGPNTRNTRALFIETPFVMLRFHGFVRRWRRAFRPTARAHLPSSSGRARVALDFHQDALGLGVLDTIH